MSAPQKIHGYFLYGILKCRIEHMCFQRMHALKNKIKNFQRSVINDNIVKHKMAFQPENVGFPKKNGIFSKLMRDF